MKDFIKLTIEVILSDGQCDEKRRFRIIAVRQAVSDCNRDFVALLFLLHKVEVRTSFREAKLLYHWA